MGFPTPSTTLTVVEGATLTRVLQGLNQDGSIPTQWLMSDTLSGIIWLAQAEAPIVSFTPTWFNAPTCQVTLNLTNAQTATLAIDTQYNLQIFGARAGVSYCIGWMYLQVIATAGSQVAAAPPDLVTGIYCTNLLQGLSLGTTQLEAIPTLITTASRAIRKWCNDRDFTQTTYSEEYQVALNGEVRLNQVPVNQILRIQAQQETGLAIQNTSSAVQIAQVYWAYTGDFYGGQTITGLNLNAVSNGVATLTPITFTSNMTVSALATAINAVGSGWKATPGTSYTSWPVTELTGGYVAQGCSINDDGAILKVFSQDVANARFHPDRGRDTGIVWCGYQYPGPGPRWGPDYEMWDDGEFNYGRVKITYNAGFAVIPQPVQQATVELVKAMLERLKTDLILQSETAGKYSYQIALEMVEAIPKHVRGNLSQYRITNA